MDGKERMITQHLLGRDIDNDRVLRAMQEVEREIFVPEGLKYRAYEDAPLPIGEGQTISQPYIVAYMAQILNPQPDEIMLEVGSGCGYNAAVLAQLCSHVYSVEVIEWLAKLAKRNLDEAGIKNVSVMYGDGYHGWPEHAPFDKIMLTAAAPKIPDKLKEQLKIGGKILAPVSNSYQKLILLEKKGENDYIEHDLIYVRFVPMTGESQRHE
ncbi:MAG: protein-L-isoaspartate(D-aspartate) O-methyltransferase [Bacteroidota bacterium]